MNSKKPDRRNASRLTHGLLAAATAALVVMPIAFAGASGGPVASKSASLSKQVKSLKKRVAALESKQTGTNTTTLGAPSGPAGGDLTGTYPNPTIGANKVTGAEVADDSLTGSDIANNTIFGTDDIATASIYDDELGQDSVGSSELKGVSAVVGAGVGVSAGGAGDATVTCPGSQMLIAGGYAWNDDEAGTSIIYSAPSEANPNQTWTVGGRATSANTLYAWATCMTV